MTGRSLFTHAAAQDLAADKAAPAPDDFNDAIKVLDLVGCHRHEVVVPLFEEHEGRDITHWRDTWPAPVNALIDKELDAFRARHPAAAVKCVSFAVDSYRGRKACVVILHYRDPAAVSPA